MGAKQPLLDDAKSQECAAEAGRAELVADIARRKEAMRDIRYSEPRYSEPETAEFLTDAEAAAVAQFVANGNSADMEAPKIHYSERAAEGSPPFVSEPATIRKSDSDMTSVANAQQWETWIAARLEGEQRLVLEAVGEALGELLGKEAKAHEAARSKLKDRLREVEIALANAKADITNLRSLLLTNGKDVGMVDMPWPKRSEAKSVN
jgi:hypothetical protein